MRITEWVWGGHAHWHYPRIMFEDLPYEARWSSKGEAPSTIPGEPVTS